MSVITQPIAVVNTATLTAKIYKSGGKFVSMVMKLNFCVSLFFPHKRLHPTFVTFPQKQTILVAIFECQRINTIPVTHPPNFSRTFAVLNKQQRYHTFWRCALFSTPVSFNCCIRRKALKLTGVPQTNETISAASGSKFTILWGHVEEILLLNNFFSDCLYTPQLQRYSPTKFWDGAQMAIFYASFVRPIFSASHVQHISDMYSKFALRPQQMYGRHTISDR